jgi:NAD(P)H-flavin reductase
VSIFIGRISEIKLGEDHGLSAVITCPKNMIPKPGQYVQAHNNKDRNAVLPTSLFLGGLINEEGAGHPSKFIAAPPIPPHWQPGDTLTLRGPLGHGFNIPDTTRRLGLVALGDTFARLMPLAQIAIQTNQEVAIFTDLPLPRLPTQIEANPLKALPEGLPWANFLAFDGPPEAYQNTQELLGLPVNAALPCEAQALVFSPMPCGGIADCGVCAIKWDGKKNKLICVDGPVFPIKN